MKRFFLAAAAVLALLALPDIAHAQEAGIRMIDGSWDDVLAEARRQNKPIYLDAFASWCGPCKVLKRDIFSRQDVGDYFNANYVSTSMDMEKGEGIELAKRYNVTAYPTHLYFDPDGTIVHRAVGGSSGDDFAATFMKWAEEARNPELQLYALKRRFDQGERDPEMLRHLSLTAKGSGMEEAPFYALEYFRTQNDEQMLEEKNWEAIKMLVEGMDDPGFNRFYRTRKLYAERYGDVPVQTALLRIVGGELRQLQSVSNLGDRLYSQADSLFHVTASAEEVTLLGRQLLGYYQSKSDWNNYARTAVRFVDKGGIEDPDELNELAWSFYEHVADREMLAVAATWAGKALSKNENYAIADTYASLLFKLGKKKEARTAAERAINIGKKEGANIVSTEDLLTKIRKM